MIVRWDGGLVCGEGKEKAYVVGVGPLGEAVAEFAKGSLRAGGARAGGARVGVVEVGADVGVVAWVAVEDDGRDVVVVLVRERWDDVVLGFTLGVDGEGGAGQDQALDDGALRVSHDDDLGVRAGVEVRGDLLVGVLHTRGDGVVAEGGRVVDHGGVGVGDGIEDGIDVGALDSEASGRNLTGSTRGEDVDTGVASLLGAGEACREDGGHSEGLRGAHDGRRIDQSDKRMCAAKVSRRVNLQRRETGARGSAIGEDLYTLALRYDATSRSEKYLGELS